MEDELIIGARKSKAPSKESLNLERNYSLHSFENYIVNFQKEKVAQLVKEGNLFTLNQRFNLWRIFLKVFDNFTPDAMIKSLQDSRAFYMSQSSKFILVKK